MQIKQLIRYFNIYNINVICQQMKAFSLLVIVFKTNASTCIMCIFKIEPDSSRMRKYELLRHKNIDVNKALNSNV